MKIVRNVAAPIICIIIYFVAMFLGIIIADFLSTFEINEITYRIQRRPFNPYMYFITLAVIRAGVLQFSIIASTYISVATKKGFLPGTFVFCIVSLVFSTFALINIVPSMFVNVTFENTVYLIEEVIKAAMSGLFAFLSFHYGDNNN